MRSRSDERRLPAKIESAILANMDTLEAPKLIEVKLPVCPHPGCGAVGKLPGHSFNGRWTCAGSTTQAHVRKNMVYKTFRQVPDEEE